MMPAYPRSARLPRPCKIWTRPWTRRGNRSRTPWPFLSEPSALGAKRSRRRQASWIRRAPRSQLESGRHTRCAGHRPRQLCLLGPRHGAPTRHDRWPHLRSLVRAVCCDVSSERRCPRGGSRPPYGDSPLDRIAQKVVAFCGASIPWAPATTCAGALNNLEPAAGRTERHGPGDGPI